MKKNILIALLILVSAFCIYKLYQEGNNTSHGFLYPKGDSTYGAWADNYREPFIGKRLPYGVWYDSASIRYYLDSIYPRKISEITMGSGANYNDYKWGVGFYFMRQVDDNGKKRFNFCVVPTLIYVTPDKKDTTVLDFFNQKDPNICKLYNRCKPKFMGGQDSIGYDAGHLWP